MTAFVQEPCHQGIGLLKLVPPYWGKPRIAALLLGYLNEVQALEDAIWTYLDGIDVDTCARFALEGLAAIVGESRRPADTEVLRIYVKARIAANRSDGTAIAIATLLAVLAADETFIVHEGTDEVRVLQLTGESPAPAASAAVLDETAQAGCRAVWLECDGRLVRGVHAHGSVPRSKFYG
jgi:hypothetical protein